MSIANGQASILKENEFSQSFSDMTGLILKLKDDTQGKDASINKINDILEPLQAVMHTFIEGRDSGASNRGAPWRVVRIGRLNKLSDLCDDVLQKLEPYKMNGEGELHVDPEAAKERLAVANQVRMAIAQIKPLAEKYKNFLNTDMELNSDTPNWTR